MPKIDHREHDEMQGLADAKGWVVEQLECGDYESDPDVQGKVILVERKSDDFLQSMINGDIFHQIKRMNNSHRASQSFLVVDRPFTDVMREAIMRDMYPNVVYGYLATLSEALHHPPVFLDSKINVIEYIDFVFKHHIDGREKGVHERTIIGGTDILVFPGVDVVLGKRLLAKFGTFKAVANATKEQLMEVHGIGEKTAEKIYKLVNKEYGDYVG